MLSTDRPDHALRRSASASSTLQNAVDLLVAAQLSRPPDQLMPRNARCQPTWTYSI